MWLVLLLLVVVHAKLTELSLQVVGLHQFPVRPAGADINANILSEEAAGEFGLCEEEVRAAPPLAAAIRQFDSVAVDHLGSNLTLVTDGQLHLRQCLFPETTRKNISLPAYYHRFHDLRKEFQSSCVAPTEEGGVEDGTGAVLQGVAVVEEMVTKLGLDVDTSTDRAVRTVRNMALVMQKLNTTESGLHEPEPVQQQLEPGIRSRSEQVEEINYQKISKSDFPNHFMNLLRDCCMISNLGSKPLLAG